MRDETKCVFYILLGVALVISSVGWPMAWYYDRLHRTAFENGYEQVVVPGTSTTIWVKKGE